MCSINLKAVVAMVTKNDVRSFHYDFCIDMNFYHVPEIIILHTSANFVKQRTHIFSNK